MDDKYAVVVTGADGELQFSSSAMSFQEAESFRVALGNSAARIVNNEAALFLKDKAVNFAHRLKEKSTKAPCFRTDTQGN